MMKQDVTDPARDEGNLQSDKNSCRNRSFGKEGETPTQVERRVFAVHTENVLTDQTAASFPPPSISE